MENNWIKVYTTENAYTAEIIKQGLMESEIPAVVLNKQDSSYRSFGVLTVWVRPEDFEKANAYIKENEL
jgi:site-specific recombinase